MKSPPLRGAHSLLRLCHQKIQGRATPLFFKQALGRDAMRMLINLLLVLGLGACSYEPEDPGLCKLNCSKAIIGGNDRPMKFELKTTTQDITCAAQAAGEALSEPLLTHFLVYESYNDGLEDGGKRPVPSLSIDPIVNGLRSELPEHNPNVVINGDTFTPARYKGIVTPKSNWCSDSCGIVTLEVFPRCPPPGTTSEVGIQIHTGALYSNEAVFSISTEDPNN